jgi:hypothetical protein
MLRMLIYFLPYAFRRRYKKYNSNTKEVHAVRFPSKLNLYLYQRDFSACPCARTDCGVVHHRGVWGKESVKAHVIGLPALRNLWRIFHRFLVIEYLHLHVLYCTSHETTPFTLHTLSFPFPSSSLLIQLSSLPQTGTIGVPHRSSKSNRSHWKELHSVPV